MPPAAQFADRGANIDLRCAAACGDIDLVFHQNDGEKRVQILNAQHLLYQKRHVGDVIIAGHHAQHHIVAVYVVLVGIAQEIVQKRDLAGIHFLGYQIGDGGELRPLAAEVSCGRKIMLRG